MKENIPPQSQADLLENKPERAHPHHPGARGGGYLLAAWDPDKNTPLLIKSGFYIFLPSGQGKVFR